MKTRAELILEISKKADISFWRYWRGTIRQMKLRQLQCLLEALNHRR